MKRALVFDSGVGGLSVVRALKATDADLVLDYLADVAWLPYGERPDAALRARIPALLQAVVALSRPDVVVLACNTASTLALAETRAALTVPVVGVVPAVKPAAALTRSGVIGLLATPATVRRAYTDKLIADHAPDLTVIRAGSADLVRAAEDALAGKPLDRGRVAAALRPFREHPQGAAMDVMVLACTHFPLLREALEAEMPGVVLVDSGEAVARRVLTVVGVNASAGGVRCEQVFLTAGADQSGVFAAEGFAALKLLSPEQPFTIQPLTNP